MTDSRNNKTNRDGLFAEIKKHPRALAAVILFHVALGIMLSINLASDEAPPMPAAKKQNIINAVAVDARLYDEKKKQEELKKKQALERKKIEAKKLADKKRAEELKRKKELERKKADQKKKATEKKAAEKKAAEAKRQKEIAIAKKKEQEKKRLEAEKKRKAEEERKRIEAEKKRKAEEERKRIEAEKKRKAEEERKRRAEEKAEMERALQEEENARIAAERAARLQTQRQQYMMQIRVDIENNWLQPAGNIEGQSCEVFVTQTMQGDVIDVRLQSCTGDTAFQRSVERAVRSASPLPLAPNPDVYAREIIFTFKPR